MATFIALIDFTEQGIRAINESPKRADTAIARATEMGLTVKEVYWTSGAHDGVLIFEAPDQMAASAFLLWLVKAGNVRSQTLRAFDRSEFEGVLARVG